VRRYHILSDQRRVQKQNQKQHYLERKSYAKGCYTIRIKGPTNTAGAAAAVAAVAKAAARSETAVMDHQSTAC
jgi:hypothetical protein